MTCIQRDIFDITARPIIDSCMEGYNGEPTQGPACARVGWGGRGEALLILWVWVWVLSCGSRCEDHGLGKQQVGYLKGGVSHKLLPGVHIGARHWGLRSLYESVASHHNSHTKRVEHLYV